MRLSVSLAADEVAALDRFARVSGLPSRSAALRRAIQLLPRPDLEREYEAARQEWDASGDQAAWEGTVADGLTDAAR